jgi:hypothetical protein
MRPRCRSVRVISLPASAGDVRRQQAVFDFCQIPTATKMKSKSTIAGPVLAHQACEGVTIILKALAHGILII